MLSDELHFCEDCPCEYNHFGCICGNDCTNGGLERVDEVLDYAAYVASRFGNNHAGWHYSRDLGDLHSLVYNNDTSGSRHLPDGYVDAGIYTMWEEDGEYITLFQPRVGLKVLKFLKEQPDNPYAQEIKAEIERAYNEGFKRDE